VSSSQVKATPTLVGAADTTGLGGGSSRGSATCTPALLPNEFLDWSSKVKVCKFSGKSTVAEIADLLIDLVAVLSRSVPGAVTVNS
jgi:hypothetical protein